jgi:hypothetical protein
MSKREHVSRREFVHQSAVVLGTAGLAVSAAGPSPGTVQVTGQTEKPPAAPPAGPSKPASPWADIGRPRISRVLLGGNLISGFLHSRDRIVVLPCGPLWPTLARIHITLQGVLA